MARQELESMTLADFHNELRLILTSYYEGIVKMVGASGVSQKLAYKVVVQTPNPARQGHER